MIFSRIFFLCLALLAVGCTKREYRKLNNKEKIEVNGKQQLTVMSYNVRHCSPPANPDYIDVAAIAGIIRDSGAELIGLQEIDVNNERSGKNLHQARALADLTGMYFYFSKSIEYRGGAYGTAILSKYPISEEATVILPGKEGTEQRTLSLVTVTLPDGNKIRVGNTHLDYTADENALAQAEVIVKSLINESRPVFLTGDFNVVQSSRTFRYLNEYFRSSCEVNCPPTIPADSPEKAIDFIFYSTPWKMEVSMHEVLHEPTASDHRPVLAKFSW